MKSHIENFCNYMDLPLEDMTVNISEEELLSEIQNEMESVRLSHRKLRSVKFVERGDTVCLSLTGTEGKYNKKSLKLNVGMGLFDKELEEILIGHEVGDIFETAISKGKVGVEILSCERAVLPEMDDEFVRSLDIENVSTVSSYEDYLKSYYTDFFRREYLAYFAEELLLAALDQSVLFLDEEEFESCCENWPIEDREDVEYVFRLLMADCFFNGRDYRETDLSNMSMKKVDEIRSRVIKPFEAFLKDKYVFSFGEEA